MNPGIARGAALIKQPEEAKSESTEEPAEETAATEEAGN